MRPVPPRRAARASLLGVTVGCCWRARGPLQFPDVTCPGQNCGRSYHRHCLSEWLGALPSSRRALGMLFGPCPFCEEFLRIKPE